MKNLDSHHLNCLCVHRETHLPPNGHRGDVLKHDVLYLSVLGRWKQHWDPSWLGGGQHQYIFTALPVASQESNQWLGDHVDFVLWGQMPVELSDGQNNLGNATTNDRPDGTTACITTDLTEAPTLVRQSNISGGALNSRWTCVCHCGLNKSVPGVYEDGGCHSVVSRKRHSMAHFNQRFHLGAFFLLLEHPDRDLETPGWWR